jgi:LacI family transcriptional regulator
VGAAQYAPGEPLHRAGPGGAWRPNGRVRQGRLRRARELRYRPSRFARGLKQDGGTTIGLIVPDVVNPFFPELIAGVIESAAKRGWQVVTGSSQNEAEREPELLRAMAGQVDALICYLFQSDDVVAAAVEGLPTVVMSKRAEAPGFGAVDLDSAGGVRSAVRYLADRGHRELGMVDCPDAADVARRASFVAEAAALGLPLPDGAIADAEQSMAGGEAGFAALHAARPGVTAVLAFNDLVALGIYRQAKRLGLAIPGDIAVIGFDGLSLGELLEPPLTTVGLDKRLMGELAVEQAESLLNGELPEPALLPTELIARGSA